MFVSCMGAASGLSPMAALPATRILFDALTDHEDASRWKRMGADTFTLARASDSHVAALGVAWSDASGRNNAQYAPFSWRSA